MNTNTGKLYPSINDALADLKPGERPEDVVEIGGSREAAMKLADLVRAAQADKMRLAAEQDESA